MWLRVWWLRVFSAELGWRHVFVQEGTHNLLRVGILQTSTRHKSYISKTYELFGDIPICKMKNQAFGSPN